MKTHSDELFRLIKSLDTQEKVFFKAFGSRKKTGNERLSYLKLFDILDGLKEFDEDMLLNKLKKKGFTHHVSKAKNYLTKAILKSLAEYHSDTAIHFQIQNLVYQAELLYAKRLNKIANKLIAKAEKLALKHEQFNYLLVASSLKVRNIRQTTNFAELRHYAGKGISRVRHYFDCLKNTFDYENIVVQLESFDDIYGGKVKNKKLREIFNSRLLSSPEKALTYSSLRYYYHIHFLRYRLMDSWGKEAYLQQKEWVDYLESEKDNLKLRSENYIAGLGRLIATCNHSNLDKEGEQAFLKAKIFFESLPSKIKTRGVKSLFISLTSNYMSGQIRLYRPQKAIASWESVRHLVSFELIGDGLKVVLLGNLFFASYLLREYKGAMHYLNRIINFNKPNRIDGQAMARIFILIINYETGNLEALKRLSRSSQRWLLKNKFLGKFEKRLIRFFQSEVFICSGKNKNNGLNKLRNDLLAISKHAGTHLLSDFDTTAWIESLIQNRPLIDLLKERVK
ncbi:MAG: hypothetical protein HYU69_17265 [Bacteroidetes bacterium]|nr:hypothetical protein [Bacteroidota bacterium]